MSQSLHKRSEQKTTGVERSAFIMAGGWVALSALFFLILPPHIMTDAGFDSLRFVMLLVSVLLPAAMILLVAALAQAQRDMRNESFRMQASLDALRQTRPAQPAPQRPEPAGPAPVAEPARDIPPPVSAAAGAPALPKALGQFELIRALNFPDNEDDTEGFAALRLALRDPEMRQLVQASQDVLTLLSQDGIYMDDLHVDPASPDLWRQFANGSRGARVEALGGVTDPVALGGIGKRMRDDTIFHDSALHFLRRFDKLIAAFAPHAQDDALLALAETRTARAFMLLARAAGTFD